MRSPLLLSLVLLGCSSGEAAPSSGLLDAGTDSPLLADARGADGTADGSGDGASTVDASPTLITVRVHYPAGSHTVSIRGSAAPLSWTDGAPATLGADDTWTFTIDGLTAPLEWKPVLDDTTWSRGPNYAANPGSTVDVYPHFTTTHGSYEDHWPSFTSTVLPSTRGVWVYLPPTYLENSRATFPVLYMHDGQNLFDGAQAFGGNEWRVDETFDAASEDGSIREAVVIGIESTADRMGEYTLPGTGGGKGDLYTQMIATEVKPMVDAELRTRKDRVSTSMMGSSLGGLISLYAGVHHADLFGQIGAMSPSTWWNSTQILGEVATLPSQPSRPLLFYVDSGDSGLSNDDVTNTANLAAALRTAGYVDNTTLKYVVQPGAQHSEVYWAERLPAALAFMLGPRPN